MEVVAELIEMRLIFKEFGLNKITKLSKKSLEKLQVDFLSFSRLQKVESLLIYRCIFYIQVT